jgi:imidazolonepropionase-like amidohydrolase
MTDQAFVGATVIDGTGAAPIEDCTVVVSAGRIASVGPAATVDPGTEVVDVAGKYVIPGLMDANTHSVFDFRPEVLLRYEPGQYDELITEAAQVALRAGITTIFDTWGPVHALRRVRASIDAGHTTGSRIFFGGNIVGNEGPWSFDLMAWAIQGINESLGTAIIKQVNDEWESGVGGELPWMPPEDIRPVIREYVATSGVDFVKHASSAHGTKKFLTFSPDAQRAIVEETHAAGLRSQACVMTPEATKVAITAGVDLLQHVNSSGIHHLPRETVDLIAGRQLPCTVALHTDRYMEAVNQKASIGQDPWGRRLLVKDDNARELIKAGAKLLLATDGGLLGPTAQTSPFFASWTSGEDVPVHLGRSHVLWIRAAIERGMSPMDALLSTTSNIAEAYGQSDLGTVEPGKRADLLFLDADPLADPDHYLAIARVVKDGVTVDRGSLPEHPVLTTA